jgi:hypothetical protein
MHCLKHLLVLSAHFGYSFLAGYGNWRGELKSGIRVYLFSGNVIYSIKCEIIVNKER